jgi:hypothetical protein
MKTTTVAMLTIALVAVAVRPSGAQVTVRDLEVTAGAAVEGYRGNMSSVTLPVVDSTDRASAAVAEFGTRGRLLFLNTPVRGFRIDFDGGIRQFAASGFELSDYAPREVVGRLDGVYRQSLGSLGTLTAAFGYKGRSVVDRPPMPLFIQPGYGAASGALWLRFAEFRGIKLDSELMAEWADYGAHALFPQLDLLDNRSTRLEVGGTWGREWQVRFYSAVRLTDFQRQGTNLPADPFRRDRMIEAGATWTLHVPVVVQLGVSGIFNRSNSARPEYDAIRFRGNLVVPLPYDLNGTLYTSLTGKNYKHDFEFIRLVPGEEADNGSVAYIGLHRAITPTLNGQVRFGWTRAETDVGGAFYERYGLSFFLSFRPSLQ